MKVTVKTIGDRNKRSFIATHFYQSNQMHHRYTNKTRKGKKVERTWPRTFRDRGSTFAHAYGHRSSRSDARASPDTPVPLPLSSLRLNVIRIPKLNTTDYF